MAVAQATAVEARATAHSEMAEITPETKIVTLFREYPEVTDYLLDLGICSCEGIEALKRTLRDEAKERDLDLEKLLRELNRRTE